MDIRLVSKLRNEKPISIDIYSKEPNSPKIGIISEIYMYYGDVFDAIRVAFDKAAIPEIFGNKYIQGGQKQPLQIQINYDDMIIIFDNCWLNFCSTIFYNDDYAILDNANFTYESIKEINMPKGQEKEDKKNKKKLTTKEKQDKKKQKKEKQ